MYDMISNFVIAGLAPIISALESLSWIGVSTHFVKLPYLDSLIQPAADALGMELTLIKYTVSLFLVYPFAAILYALPNKNVKHLFSFVVGVLLVQWIFEADWIHSFVSALGTYVICAIAPKKHIHHLSFFWVMGYMTMSHLYRMYILYMAGIFDFTGTQMVLTMKLTSFAYNLYDGTYDYNKVFPEKPHEDKKKAKIYEARRKFAITKLPNPLEFFGYVYCFTCILAGPAFEYQDYTRSIDGDTFKIKKSDDPKLLNKSVGKPSTLLQGLRRLLVGVVCMVLHLQVAAHYKVSALYNKEFIAANGFLQRIFHVCAALLADRFKYYFAWKVAEGASILGGFGFEGYDKDGQQLGWRGVENVDILGFELSPNVQMLSRSWNKRTQGWLERYTYQRTGNSLVATYFVSAIWHGLYPGFFLFFMTLPLMTNVERLVRAKLNPYIVPGFDGRDMSTYPKGIVGQAYWVVSWFFTMTTMNYIVQPFSMGSLENSMTCLGSYYYIPHIGLLLTYVLLEVMPKPKSSDKKKSN